MAVSKYDWDFIRPLDQTANIAALSQGNQQINAGLQGVSGAVTGYADAIKQRNTDSILNALSQAQTSAQLPDAMNAVQALQQQYGRGYDQTAVRNAIDTRGSTLGQRDLQAINLQQAQAAQAAIPQLNQAAIAQGKARGMSEEQLQAYQNLGIDVSSQINSATNNTVSDSRDARDYKYREGVDTRNYNRLVQRDLVSDNHWKEENEFKIDESNFQRGFKIAAENPGSNELVFQDGKWATVNTPKISGLDAYGALSGVRGIRNNNPGNIDFHGQAGATRENGKGRFASFNTPEEGLAAMSKQLDRYASGATTGKKLQTVTDIVSSWAPSGGKDKNDTKAYIDFVSKKLGVNPNAQLNLADPNTKTALMTAMITKENGGNPYTPAQYAAGISGKSGATAQSASQAIKIPQSVAANAVSKYSEEITKLQNDFNLTTAKDQGTTTLGSKGQTIDSWLASKPVTDREGSTLFTDYASKVSKVARNNAKLSNLPMDSQLKVLDATHAWALAPGGVITDKELNKHIDNLVGSITTSNKRNLDRSRKNIFETQYQAFVADLNKAGQLGVDRDAFRALVDPQSVKSAPVKATQQPAKAPPVVKEIDNPFGEPSTATKAVQAVAPKKAEVPSYITNGAQINARNAAFNGFKERTGNSVSTPARKEEVVKSPPKVVQKVDKVAQNNAIHAERRRIEQQKAVERINKEKAQAAKEKEQDAKRRKELQKLAASADFKLPAPGQKQYSAQEIDALLKKWNK